MTEEKARKILEHVMLAAQRVRSEIAEAQIGEEVVALLYPWLTGDKNIVIGLENALSRKQVVPIDLYNLMVLVDKLPPILVWCQIHNIVLPEPDINWLRGFDETEVSGYAR